MEALTRLAKDPELRTRLGQAARGAVLAEFSDEIIVAQTLQLYGDLLAGQQDAVIT